MTGEPRRPDEIRRFDPASEVPVLVLPEGTERRAPLARLLRRGESAYDPLWRYVRRVDLLKYLGQGARVRFGTYNLGLRSPSRVPTRIDFQKELIYHGRKLVIPFASLRALMIAHGLMPSRRIPVFVVMIRVDGCRQYLPIHRCQIDRTVTDLAEFLSGRLRAPLGIASRPLEFLVDPGGAVIRHAAGSTPLYELRTVLSTRDPGGAVRVRLLTSEGSVTLLDEPDPLGWYERWGIIAGELLAIAARRARSRYGRDCYNGA